MPDIPATKITADEQVFLWLIEGVRVRDIKEAAAISYPDADVDQCIEAALDSFAVTARADGGIIRGWCLEAYRELYRRMLEIGDFSGALKAVKELIREAKTQPFDNTGECSSKPKQPTPQIVDAEPVAKPKRKPAKRKARKKTSSAPKRKRRGG